MKKNRSCKPWGCIYIHTSNLIKEIKNICIIKAVIEA